MLAMRAPHSKGPISSQIFCLIDNKPEIYVDLLYSVTRIATATTIVSKTTHRSESKGRKAHLQTRFSLAEVISQVR